MTGRGAGWHRLAKGWLAEYHVLAPDLIGHGSSPYEPPWSITEHLETLVATLGVPPAAWIGHSYGGRLAFELAARRPALVERLVLLDPAILLDAEIALHVAELAREDRSAAVASYGEMSSAPPPFEGVRIPTLLVLAEDSYVRYDDLLDAHQAALGDLLEVVTVPGGHTVLWDALEETSSAIAAFIRDEWGVPQR